MNASLASGPRAEIPGLLRGEAERIDTSIQRCTPGRALFYVAVIFGGAGLFGAAVGCWRAPLQAAYTAIKLPLILLLTTFGNALLNGMLAPLLGLNIPFRQSVLSILMSFTIAGAILGSFAPIVAYVIWNSPPMSADVHRSTGPYCFILLTFVVVIAFAGITSNLRLLQLL